MVKTLAGRSLFCILTILIPAGCTESGVEVATTAAAVDVVNTVCPIMGNRVEADDLDPTLIKEWNGKKVGFCCPPCLEEWDELTDAEKAEKLSEPSDGQQDVPHHDGHDHGAHEAATESPESN